MTTTQLFFFFFPGAPPAGAFSPSVGQGTTKDFFQVLRSVFDPTNQALRATTPGGASGDPSGARDAHWILKDVYDPDTNSLRVTEI